MGISMMYRSDGTVQAAPRNWGPADGKLRSIVVNPGQFEDWQGAGGTPSVGAQDRLTYALGSSWDSELCASLLDAALAADGLLKYMNTVYGLVDSETGLMYTGFNSFDHAEKYSWERYIGRYGSNNKFYGVPNPIPARSPRQDGSPRVPVGSGR
jgi:hypothetical protein